jgi:hypothetical protein
MVTGGHVDDSCGSLEDATRNYRVIGHRRSPINGRPDLRLCNVNAIRLLHCCPIMDSAAASPYNHKTFCGARRARRAQVAQLVEHVTENHGVGGSIPPLGTNKINDL